ncbi:hypothetical protein [Candidatus Westeberhardia cardiocondylae]|uniref:hypothetical protein n=1 Tax=Candidatus Westeberhardia cardiocondylae TaxID=1594731 RepID=UPI003B967D2C
MLVIFNFTSHHKYYNFLENSSIRVGKINQDHFSLTLYIIFLSILLTLPILILWTTLDYELKKLGNIQ